LSAAAERRRGALFIIAASVCWSFGGLCIKFIPWDAMTIVGLRAAFAAAVFIAYRRSAKINFTKGNVLAAVCLSSTTTLFVFANKLTTAASAILLQFTAPVFIIIIHLVFYSKKPKPSELIAVAATLAGMLLFFADDLDAGAMLGNFIAIASGLSFAGVFVCNNRPDTQPEQALLLGFIVNVIIGLPFVLTGVTAEPAAWGLIVFLGVVQVGLAYVFFAIGIKKTTALLACLITAIEPVLNPIWVAVATYLIIGAPEIPGPAAVAGGAIIIISVVGYNVWVEKKEKARPANT